jgi:phage replication-related protein YjqB (UPF0714/DUF867 family)
MPTFCRTSEWEYPTFAGLVSREKEGVDFDRVITPRPGAHVLLIAPHGGTIEPDTDTIASVIAGEQMSLYCFRIKEAEKKG